MGLINSITCRLCAEMFANKGGRPTYITQISRLRFGIRMLKLM